LISNIPRCHLITSPVFGAPAAADKAQLILCMSGDYRSKKEAAFVLVPAMARKVIDLGQNLEKGEYRNAKLTTALMVPVHSTNAQANRQLYAPRLS
jgi:3-hydroxyisobutyrate dehydrogenase-like beta-hydroxyacid dehydrogenase